MVTVPMIAGRTPPFGVRLPGIAGDEFPGLGEVLAQFLAGPHGIGELGIDHVGQIDFHQLPIHGLEHGTRHGGPGPQVVPLGPQFLVVLAQLIQPLFHLFQGRGFLAFIEIVVHFDATTLEALLFHLAVDRPDLEAVNALNLIHQAGTEIHPLGECLPCGRAAGHGEIALAQLPDIAIEITPFPTLQADRITRIPFFFHEVFEIPTKILTGKVPIAELEKMPCDDFLILGHLISGLAHGLGGHDLGLADLPEQAL